MVLEGAVSDTRPDQSVYTMAEAAHLKGVSYHTVSRAVRRGTLPNRRIGRLVLVAAKDLQGWRPMVQRAPKKYRRREVRPGTAPTLLELASGDRAAIARQVTALVETAHALVRDLPLGELLGLLGGHLASTLDLHRVEVWGVDEGAGGVRWLAAAGHPMSNAPERGPLAEAPDIARCVDADAAPGGVALIAAGTLVTAPLRAGGRVLGVALGDRSGGPFELEPNQLVFARAVADQMAVALELGRLRAVLGTEVSGLAQPSRGRG